MIAGGHTIDDPEPKYGMAVTGEVDPARILTNAGLRPGQHLVLTKALGVGVLTTAIKAGLATEAETDAVVASMTRLNDDAAAAAVAAGATGATDVTGFGLAGHLGRMAIESGVRAVVEVASLPFLPGAVTHARAGVVPGGSRRNLAWATDHLDVGDHDETTQLLVADAQTSGGLVFGVDADAATGVVDTLTATGHAAAVIGTVEAVADGAGSSARLVLR